MAYISYLVNQSRHRNGDCRPDEVLLLDSGDIFMGSTMSNLLQWQPMAAIYDTMKYDAVTIGNHEFDKGLEYAIKPDGTMMDYELNGVKHINTVPFTMCNLYQNGKKVDWIPEYLILDKTAVDDDGNELKVKIGVIGFSENYGGSIMPDQFADLGYEIREDYDYLNSLARDLKEKQNCNAVIVLMHGNSDEGAEALGADSPVDVVLGGHLHKFRFGVTEYGLKYAQPGNKGDSVIEAELIFQKKDDKAELITVKDVHPRYIINDKEYLYDLPENYNHLDRYVLNTGNAYLLLLAQIIDVKIGYITVSALRREYIPDSKKHASTAGNWVASMLQRVGEADVGLVNVGGLRQDYKIPEGSDRLEIKVGDVYTLFPFDDPLYVYQLTYEEFLELMEYAVDHQGRSLMSCMVGIDCYYDYDKEIVNAIVTKDGEAIYDHGVWKDGWKEKTLTVAMKSFMASSDRFGESGKHNPMNKWEKTDRLIRTIDDLTDPVLDVLTTEAENNNGHLEIDEKAHFLALDYTGGN
jgi:2',3'-cyclic-nucleotide 2'-phosphodiesterase (5'-nucleotidase family)